MIKICPNRGYIFKNKLRNTWAAILTISAVSGCKFRRLIGRAKDKNKSENIQADDQPKFNIGKDIYIYIYLPTHAGSYELAFIVNQKWKNKVYKLGKVDGKPRWF